MADQHDSLERPLWDAVISIHGVQFNVNKFILCDCSTYFRALFLHHSAPDRKEFEVPDLSATTMQLIIDFAHTGSVAVTEDNVQELLQAANRFIITGIEQACCNFLLERLSSENCIGIWQLCNFCFYPELQKSAYRYLLINFEEVVSRDEFQQLSFKELSDIFDSDELNVRQEMTLCQVIVKWVAYDIAGRWHHFAVLLSKVRLALTSHSYITGLMKIASVYPECMEIVQKAHKLKTYMSMLTPSLSICSNRAARPRLPNGILFAIGGDDRDRKRTDITEVYDFKADRWITMSYRGAFVRAMHGTVHCNNSVYCVGGIDANCTLNVVYRLDLVTHTWLEVAPMYHRRNNLGVTVLDGFIYAIGGHDGRHPISSAERYDPQTNQWTLIASMQEQRTMVGCASLHNKIYISGGHNGNSYLDTCECYCPETNQWTKLTSMGSPRSWHGVIAYEDQIFAVGGVNDNSSLKTVEAYNPLTETWHVVSPMSTSRFTFGIAVIDNKLFAVGGYNPIDGSVEFYDRSTNLWSEACKMGVPRHFLSSCVVSGLPNVAEHVISRDHLRRLDEEEVLVES